MDKCYMSGCENKAYWVDSGPEHWAEYCPIHSDPSNLNYPAGCYPPGYPRCQCGKGSVWHKPMWMMYPFASNNGKTDAECAIPTCTNHKCKKPAPIIARSPEALKNAEKLWVVPCKNSKGKDAVGLTLKNDYKNSDIKIVAKAAGIGGHLRTNKHGVIVFPLNRRANFINKHHISPKPPQQGEKRQRDISFSNTECSNTECPICFSKNSDHALACGHLFCGDCAKSLKNCGLCRKPVGDVRQIFFN